MVNNDSSSLVSFSNFSGDLRQTNCGVPLNSHHMTSFAEETGDHLLASASSKNNFCWIWLVFEDPYGKLLFCFELIRHLIDLINVFCSTTIVFFSHFFFEQLSNCAAPNENKSFYGQVLRFMPYGMYAGGRNVQGCLDYLVLIIHFECCKK